MPHPPPIQPGPPGTLLAQALYDFVAVDDSQMSFAAGDYIYVNATDPLGEDDDEDWIYARHQVTGAEGFIPSTFLKEVPRELIEVERISSELRNMMRLREVEEKLRQGFEEVLANPSLKKQDRTVVQTKQDDCEGRILELDEKMKRFQEIIANLLSGNLDNEDDDEDDDEEPLEKPPPIPPFTGVLKSILKSPDRPQATLAEGESKRHVQFTLPEKLEPELTDAQTFVINDAETFSLGENALGSDGNHPMDPRYNSLASADAKPPISPTIPKPNASSLPHKGKSTRTGSGLNIFKRKGKKSVPSSLTDEEQVIAEDIKDAILTGHLWTDSNSNLKSWSKRYLVLKKSVLYIYKKPTDTEPHDKLILPSYVISPLYDKNKQWAFRASHSGMATRMFAADDKAEFTMWMNAMSLATIVEEKDFKQPSYRRKRESLQEGLALKSFRDLVDAYEDDKDKSRSSGGGGGGNDDVTTRNKDPITSTALSIDNNETTVLTDSTVTALFDHDAKDERELSFKAGDKIVVVQSLNDAWVEGKLGNVTGLVPRQFFKL